MRVLHLIPNLSGGGAEQQLVYLANELSARAHQVTVGFLRNGPAECGLDSSVETRQLRARNSYDPRILSQLIQLIRENDPCIVQSWMLQMDVFAGAACAVSRAPWIVREPSNATAYPTRWKRLLRERVCRTAAAIVSNSKGGDEYWQQHAPHVTRLVVRNGIPLRRINAAPRARREDLSAPADGPLMVYAGRFAPGKNLDRLVEALARVSVTRKVTTVFCGDGILREQIERLAVAKLGERAVFLGFIEPVRLWGILKLADGFLFPSEFEGMPNVVAEAMACECPVMVSDIPAHRDIANEDSAIFVDPSDIGAIADGIARVLETSGEARIAAARRAVATWSIDAMVDRYEELYERVRIGSRRKHISGVANRS